MPWALGSNTLFKLQLLLGSTRLPHPHLQNGNADHYSEYGEYGRINTRSQRKVHQGCARVFTTSIGATM
jgi:hypothetical protein